MRTANIFTPLQSNRYSLFNKQKFNDKIEKKDHLINQIESKYGHIKHTWSLTMT